MTFLHPEFIYYMLPPLIILFALFLSQKEKQAVFFSDEVMEKLRVNSKRLSLRARNALFFIIGILLIFALAEPVIPDGKIQVQAKSADIMIGLDISDSMLATDVYPSRLELAKHKILSLAALAPTERIGVVAFAKAGYLVSPLSFDHDAVSFLVKQLSTNSITEKGTDFMQLLSGVDESMKDQKKRYLLILSDGGDDSDFSEEIAYAKEHHIMVFVLGMGTSSGAPIKSDTGFVMQKGKIIISKLNSSISSLATETGGVYIEGVNSDRDIEKMLSEIETKVQQKTLKSQMITKFIPLFHIPIGFALFLLLLAISSMSKREVVHVPSAFIVGLVLAASTPSHAGLLDFKLLGDAKKAYENADFQESTSLYKKYLKDHESNEANYNLASSLYKNKKYSEAADIYKKVNLTDKVKQAGVLYNLANSYAKSGELQQAVEMYKQSLALKSDADAKINKEIVEKLLKEQQEKNKQNRDQNQKEQDQSNKEKNNQGNSQQNKDQNKDQSKENQDRNQQDKEKQKNQNKQDQQNEENSVNKPSNSSMSNKEEQKWLQRLNSGTPTHMYKLGTTKTQKDNKNEKPW
ncbi:MAG: VWA domain-containing protein [Thiovulaceae bacterium]|nr:VWA domain-containing protein [Sulfurimonadaceae bacterium]